MIKTTKNLIAAFFISTLALPLHAQTALEQFGALSPGTEIAVPPPALPAAALYEPALSPEEAMKKLPLFDYSRADVVSVTRSVPEVHKGYSVEKIELVISDPLRQLGEFRQEFIYYRTTKPGPRPTTLIFPPFVPQKLDDWSAAHFTRKGFNAIIIAPAESLTDTTRPLDKVDDMLIRGVIVARMCVDLLETFPEVDKEKIYAYGISMGGIRTSLSFGVEKRIKKAIEIVGGGDLPGIIADTRFKLLKELRDARMQAEGLATVEDFRAYMKKVMTVDPMDFARLRNPEDILMVLGQGDRFVPDAYQEKLYSAFSRPEEGRYPVTKRSIVGHLPTAAKFMRYIDLFADFTGN